MSLKRFKKIVLWFFLSLLFLILAAWIFIETPAGQNWIARQITRKLSRDLQTKVSIDHVSFSLFNRMHLEGVLIEDRQKDTLLYAGDLKMRITDWFFFKKEAVIKYVGLENAIVKFQRTDSVWRQQFIFDYFSSSSSGSSKKKKSGIHFDLRRVEMKNVVFLKRDAWLGQDMIVKVGSMNLDAKAVDFSKKTLDFSKAEIIDPDLRLFEYARLKPHKIRSDSDTDNIKMADELLQWNQGDWAIRLDKLMIVNGIFRTDQQTTTATLSSFDGRHIEFNSINGEFTNTQFYKDTISSNLHLQAKERSGFEVKNLLTAMKWTPKEMSFSQLDLTTNRSVIRNSFTMSYENFNDLGDFNHKVNMTASFEDADIDSDDLAFFGPSMKTWKKKIRVNGNVRGPLDALVGKGLEVQAGSSTYLNGDISLTGLPDINHTFIDFKANNFRTTYGDAMTMVPAISKIQTPDLAKLGRIDFTGNFTGFIRDFVTFGTIQTNLGVVKTDLNMKFPAGEAAVYSGNISTDNFRVGEFIREPDLGSISMTGEVKGKGFHVLNRNAVLDGKINYVDYKGYRYHDITIKGKLDKKLFDGVASINDENANLTLNGVIDFNNPTPKFDFFADVKKADLKSLHLISDSIAFKGKFNLDFTGDNIDNFLGSARITNAVLTRNGSPLPFDSLIASTSGSGNQKTLKVNSNEFAATISGDYNINELPNAFRLFLNKYYPAYISPPKRFPGNESFHFDITTAIVDDYVKLVDSSLSGFNNSHVYGDLNLGSNQLTLHAETPHFKYAQYNFDDAKVDAKGTYDSLYLSGEARNINFNDSLVVPLAIFNIRARNDSSEVKLISGTNRSVNKANLDAMVLTYNDGVKIEFNPSSFVVNGKTWTIDENGVLELRKRSPASGQLVLREGEQRLTLRTLPSQKGNWNDLNVNLTKINLGDFSPFFLPKNRMEGLLSGTVMVEDPVHNLNIHSDDLHTEFFRLDNDSLGEIKTSIAYDNKTGELKVNGNTVNQENYIGFTAKLFPGDKSKQKDNIIALKPRNFQLSVLQRFLGNLFTNITGSITGDITISGEFDQMVVAGKGQLKDAEVKVIFTQCFYKIQDTEVELKPSLIDLNGLVLIDPVTNHPIYVNGTIQHQAFKNMIYDISISTRKPNSSSDFDNQAVQLLSTTYKNNRQFYGNVKGTGSLTLTGPQSNLFMKIDAAASTKDSSNITIPPSGSRESGIADFLVERKYGVEMNAGDNSEAASNMVYDVDITANPMVSVRVVLDDLTGDEIKGRGAGSLNIYSGTNEPLSIRGRFDIEDGNYLFTFQSFFKKPFELRKGSDNFIEWTGDPYKANIHFDAVYRAERINFAPLVSQLDPAYSKVRGDVYVVASLTDDLFRPTIRFSLDFPPSSPAITDPGLALIMQQLQKNENEMAKQVTYLIVFNSFAPGGDNNVLTGREYINSISGIFLDVISDQINRILDNLVKNDKYKINVNTSLYNYNRYIIDPNNNTAFNLASNVNFSIGRSFFNDRFVITAGGGFDAPLQQSTIQQSIQLLPDVTMEWAINKSGSLRASFFYRENTDYLSTSTSQGAGRARRYGTSLTFRRDFDKIKDLFKKKSSAPPTIPVQKSSVPEGNLPKNEPNL